MLFYRCAIYNEFKHVLYFVLKRPVYNEYLFLLYVVL